MKIIVYFFRNNICTFRQRNGLQETNLPQEEDHLPQKSGTNQKSDQKGFKADVRSKGQKRGL